MRRLKQIAGEETMTAAELADGLVTMNGLMHGFRTKGIHYAHTDLTATATVNMPDELIDSLTWLIAEGLAPEYGYAFSPKEELQILAALQALQAGYKYIPPAPSPRGVLRNMTGRYFNIERGE
jgi:hypothetical protein